jgi:hypothetical protein
MLLAKPVFCAGRCVSKDCVKHEASPAWLLHMRLYVCRRVVMRPSILGVWQGALPSAQRRQRHTAVSTEGTFCWLTKQTECSFCGDCLPLPPTPILSLSRERERSEYRAPRLQPCSPGTASKSYRVPVLENELH